MEREEEEIIYENHHGGISTNWGTNLNISLSTMSSSSSSLDHNNNNISHNMNNNNNNVNNNMNHNNNSNNMNINNNGGGHIYNGPVYVNARQYARILKRREAKLLIEAKMKMNPPRKRYLHESRHNHACKRPRGTGGRFLTKAELEAREPTDIGLDSTSEFLTDDSGHDRGHGHGHGNELISTDVSTSNESQQLPMRPSLASFNHHTINLHSANPQRKVNVSEDSSQYDEVASL